MNECRQDKLHFVNIERDRVLMKLYITGIVAGGKTILAKRISEKLNIPYYELDSIAHDDSVIPRRRRTSEEQISIIKEIDRKGDYIFEGVYRESYHELLNISDIILFLDPPLYVRRYRIIKRFIKQKLRLEKSYYKPTLHMFKCMFRWTSNFENNRDEFVRMLQIYQDKLIVAKSSMKAERIIYARIETK
ncbi:MAG: hypothetical protein EOM87_05850 [Clostridia bacterium]|nr:hypothetical protein [Clostridia bacterium]